MPDGDEVWLKRGDQPSRRSPIIRSELRIGDYLAHFERGPALMRQNCNEAALREANAAIALAPTLYARYNRAIILLALGRWREGFEEYRQTEVCEPFTRPRVRDALKAGLKLWNGEEIAGKRLLLLHAHGFGDTIMTLRFVQLLRKIGADVRLLMPDELKVLAAQVAPINRTGELDEADYVCPMLYLPGLLGITPSDVYGEPYLSVGQDKVGRWRGHLGPGRHIGIAWTTKAPVPGDYPRPIPLDRLVNALSAPGTQLHSVQKQGGLEALRLGVRVHEIENFADCAALMLAMDHIVSVDTAALHLAGAIGHPRVDGLLSHWASFRWLAPWYANVRLCRQTSPDDWDSALEQLA
jgi:hypothetical protein